MLESKIISQISNFYPSHKSKRSLFDGLGSIIKSITGNLDHYDAERYDDAIATLTNNQGKLKIILKDQISLLQTSIKNFQENVKTLQHNQVVLKSRILQLEQVIKSTTLSGLRDFDYFLLEVVLSQITNSMQIIYDTFEKIEVATTFAKLNVFHNSIVDSRTLINEINEISKNISNIKFPFESKLEDVRLIEKTIRTHTYFKNGNAIFTLEIPVVENKKYDYFRLHPLPVRSNSNQFKVIIPNSKFLILNEKHYANFNEACLEMKPQEYLCEDLPRRKITSKDDPCEIQLLRYSKSIHNCHPIPAIVQEIQVKKINMNEYLTVIPNVTVATQRCRKSKSNIPLNGTYLIEIDDICEIEIQNIILKTFKTNSRPNFGIFNMPSIELPDAKPKLKKLNLYLPNQEGHKFVLDQLDEDSKRINQILEKPIQLKSISIFTIFLYVVLTVLATIYVVQKILHRFNYPLQEEGSATPPESTSRDACPIQCTLWRTPKSSQRPEEL